MLADISAKCMGVSHIWYSNEVQYDWLTKPQRNRLTPLFLRENQKRKSANHKENICFLPSLVKLA